MFNSLKTQKLIPQFMNFANVTTVPKKGSRIEPSNERGIFRVSVLRSIFMRLMYDMKYPIINQNICDCQMGGRKKKSSKNNIFLVNSLIHEAIKSKKPICLQIGDYKQMFDGMNLKEALCDLYDVGVQDETLKLLFEANNDIKMAVKTPSGLTQRQVVSNSVLQGDTWGSLLASVQVDAIGQESMAAGHGYLYKDTLHIGFLGMVDDIVGITEPGIQAQKMNAFLNIKTAEKYLQFGVEKCKSMLIGKQSENCINSELMVDKWSVCHKENKRTGEAELVEEFFGLTPISKTEEQKYLGFVLSSTADNMANIRAIKNKSIGVVKSALNKLNSLNLQHYYFESSVIVMNVMIRSSILYASEMYIELKESEIRQLERIEEGFMRKVFNTTKGCPIVQLYLSLGHVPARYEIKKIKLLFMKYILEEEEDSLIKKMFNLQQEKPTRGDWASSCLKDLKDLKMCYSLEEIKAMSYNNFKKLVKISVKNASYTYLTNKCRSKGKENIYSELSMAEYLLPENKITISEKQRLFSVKNRMIKIPSNFPKSKTEYTCQCGMKEDQEHIYNCETYMNEKKNRIEYEKLYTGTISEQVEVFRILENNLELREEFKIEANIPCDQLYGPLSVMSVMG